MQMVFKVLISHFMLKNFSPDRILVYTMLELLFSEFVPEIQDSLQFYRRVTREK